MDYTNKKLIFLAKGTDVLDPKKGPPIIEQMLDAIEAAGVKFAPERKRKSAHKRTRS